MKKVYILNSIFLTILTLGAMAQPTSQTFNTSGTYVVPTGFTANVTIEAWGAGGGGGNAGAESGGGGGGAYAKVVNQVLTAGSYTVTVGTGGTPGVNGGNSSFTTIVVAAGGSSTNTVAGGAGGTTAASTGTILFAGGAGGSGGNNNSAGGGGGGSATSIAVGGAGGLGLNGNNAVGGAGGIGQGNGGAGANNTNAATAVAGTAPGGGGGGRASNATTTSANGANGRVVVTVNSVLPVQFTYFNAGFASNKTSILNWQASCSSNQVVFDVERSTDGRNFISIYSITASQARCAQPFSYTDNTMPAGLLFYRIRSTDIDGATRYSAVIKLGNPVKSTNLEALVPNPVMNEARLSIQAAKKDNVELQIISLEGKPVQKMKMEIEAGTSIINLDMSRLQSGLYIIKGVFSDGSSNAVKFIKQ